eukprot:545207_1
MRRHHNESIISSKQTPMCNCASLLFLTIRSILFETVPHDNGRKLYEQQIFCLHFINILIQICDLFPILNICFLPTNRMVYVNGGEYRRTLPVDVESVHRLRMSDIFLDDILLITYKSKPHRKVNRVTICYNKLLIERLCEMSIQKRSAQALTMCPIAIQLLCKLWIQNERYYKLYRAANDTAHVFGLYLPVDSALDEIVRQLDASNTRMFLANMALKCDEWKDLQNACTVSFT